jgi:hypothetical protein
MLICFRFLIVLLATSAVALSVAGCSKKQVERTGAKTGTERTGRVKSDQDGAESRRSNTTATSNDSEQSTAAENSGDSNDVNPLDKQRHSKSPPGSVSANDEYRANSQNAAGGADGRPGVENRSTQKKSTTPGSSPGYTSDGDPDYKPPSDPRAAQAAAERALAAAEKAARSNAYGTAYRVALTGWQDANAYSKQDEKCRDLARTLLKHLERYGEKANQAAGVVDSPPPSNKTLILK